MSLAISGLKSGAVGVTVLFSKLYDQMVKGNSIADGIAQRVPAKGRQRIQRLAWGEAFPQMRRWVGDRILQEVFKEEILIEIDAFEVTYGVDFVDMEIDGDNAVLNIQDVAKHFVTGYEAGIASRAYEPLRKNQLSYDGQNLFDTDHVHPDGDTGSNILDLSDLSISRSTAGVPTMEEADRELSYAESKLEENRLRVADITEIADQQLVVVCKSIGTWRGYRALQKRTLFPDGSANERRGTFRLMRDWSPESGDEAKVDVISATPGGPRPSVLIEVQRPGAIEVDRPSKLARKGAIGNHGIYGFGAGFWQAAVRLQA